MDLHHLWKLAISQNWPPKKKNTWTPHSPLLASYLPLYLPTLPSLPTYPPTLVPTHLPTYLVTYPPNFSLLPFANWKFLFLPHFVAARLRVCLGPPSSSPKLCLSVCLCLSLLFGSVSLVERELGKEGKKKQQRTWRRKKRWEKTSI